MKLHFFSDFSLNYEYGIVFEIGTMGPPHLLCSIFMKARAIIEYKHQETYFQQQSLVVLFA